MASAERVAVRVRTTPPAVALEVPAVQAAMRDTAAMSTTKVRAERAASMESQEVMKSMSTVNM